MASRDNPGVIFRRDVGSVTTSWFRSLDNTRRNVSQNFDKIDDRRCQRHTRNSVLLLPRGRSNVKGLKPIAVRARVGAGPCGALKSRSEIAR